MRQGWFSFDLCLKTFSITCPHLLCRASSCSTWWTTSRWPTTMCTCTRGGARWLAGALLSPPCSASPSAFSTNCSEPREPSKRSEIILNGHKEKWHEHRQCADVLLRSLKRDHMSDKISTYRFLLQFESLQRWLWLKSQKKKWWKKPYLSSTKSKHFLLIMII